jgi:hypothetical protein
MEFSGSYLNSRRIEDFVHTVIVFPEIILPDVRYWPEELLSLWQDCWLLPEIDLTEEEVRELFDGLRTRNVEIIDNTSLADFLPSVRDTKYVDGNPVVNEELLQDCESFFLTQSGDGESLLSLVSVQIDALNDVQSSTIIGRPGAVYASQNSLYIAARHYAFQIPDVWFFSSTTLFPEATTFHKFDLLPDGSSDYSGSGVVKGRVLNQFSMDEHEGHLRIATTTGRAPSANTHSTLSVVDADSLDLVGVRSTTSHRPRTFARSDSTETQATS